MSKFKNGTKQLDELFKKLSDNRARRQAAEERINDAKAAIQAADAGLRAALLKNDPKAIKEYEAQIEKFQAGVLARDTLLIEELDKEHKTLEPLLSEKQTAQKKHFAENAAKVLNAEIGTHDRAAKELKESTRRLLAVYQLLRDAGHPETYRAAVGDCLEFIPSSSIPIISQFERTAHLNRVQFQITADLLNAVRASIEEA